MVVWLCTIVSRLCSGDREFTMGSIVNIVPALDLVVLGLNSGTSMVYLPAATELIY